LLLVHSSSKNNEQRVFNSDESRSLLDAFKQERDENGSSAARQRSRNKSLGSRRLFAFQFLRLCYWAMGDSNPRPAD
jgi:DNA repair ATPase RecN